LHLSINEELIVSFRLILQTIEKKTIT